MQLMVTISYLIFIPILLAVVYSVAVMFHLRKQSNGTAKMQEISRAIQEGSSAYLARQYKAVSVVAIIVTALLWYFLGYIAAFGFVIGAVASALAGYIGMQVA